MSFDGKRIKAAAAQAGLTLTELAGQMGVSRATLYAYVANNINPPDDRIRHLSELTGCPVSFFAAPDQAAEDEKVESQLRLVDALLSSSNPRAAAEVLDSCLEDVSYDRRGELILRLGNSLVTEGNFQEAIPTLMRAKSELQKANERHGVGRCFQSLGFCYAHTGPLEQASLCFREAEQNLREADRWKAWVALAVVAERRGDYALALKSVDRASSTSTEPMAKLYCRGVRSNILASLGEWHRVYAEELEIVAEAEALGAADQLCERLIATAMAAIYIGSPKKDFHVAQALGFLQSAGDKARSAYFATVRSLHALAAGNVEEARTLAIKTLTASIKGKYRRAELGAYLRLAEAALACDNLDEASMTLLKATAYAESYEYASELDYAEVLSAFVAARQGKAAEAREHLSQTSSRPQRNALTVLIEAEVAHLLQGNEWNQDRFLHRAPPDLVSYLPGFTVTQDNKPSFS